VLIDFHTHVHLQDILTEKYWRGWVGVAHVQSGVPKEKIRRKIESTGFTNWGCDELVRDMDEGGIDKALIIAVDLGWCKEIGTLDITWEDLHKPIIEGVRKYPNRLLAECGIDPRRPNAVQLLEKAVREWGVKGVKLVPYCGVAPNDRVCYPLWEKAQELGIIIHIHTGTEPYPFRNKWSQPMFVDDVACDFPDVQIVMAHCGMWEWQQAMTVAVQKPNVWVDLTAWQQWAHTNLVEFFRAIRTMCDWMGYRRIMIGSDWPAVSLLMGEKRWFDVFRDIPDEIQAAGIEFKEKEIDGILGDNAARLLGLIPGEVGF
jgi:hypothetical protein